MNRLFWAFAFLLVHCTEPRNIRDVEIESVDGRQISIDSLLDVRDHTAFVFFSPECPICIQSVDELLAIDSVHKSLVYVYPGTYYNDSSIHAFHKEYRIDALALMDTSNTMVRLLKAEVTPQAIVTNRKGETVYTGAIDDRSPDFGVKRIVITERYLASVLDSLSKGSKPPYPSTVAHGCFIE
jgi:hypothetical protein